MREGKRGIEIIHVFKASNTLRRFGEAIPPPDQKRRVKFFVKIQQYTKGREKNG